MKKNVKLSIEMDENGARIEIEGSNKEITRALGLLIYSWSNRCNIDVGRLSQALPMIVMVASAEVGSETVVDLSALGRAAREQEANEE